MADAEPDRFTQSCLRDRFQFVDMAAIMVPMRAWRQAVCGPVASSEQCQLSVRRNGSGCPPHRFTGCDTARGSVDDEKPYRWQAFFRTSLVEPRMSPTMLKQIAF